ncbi:MAG: alpha/beta hydrolase [bacterium]|nr:alpha/beta hydrolase [bacterium]
MERRVFIVHRWDGSPDSDWYPWLEAQLEDRGYRAKTIEMPNPEAPEIKAWLSALDEAVGQADENTYFVGHSVGCQAILRYLAILPVDQKIGGAVFVAGWFKLIGLETDEEKEIAKPWLETPFDLEIARAAGGKMAAIFSDNDPFVPLSNTDIFEKKLGAKIVIEKGAGHFNDIEELPLALGEILEIID